MRATLMHNPRAGSGEPSADALLAMIRAAGYDVAYQSTKADDYAAALQDPGDLVVAAGGDGTVRKIACRIASRGIPMAILPLGTANNIAESFGLSGSIPELIDGWGDAARRHLRIGVVAGAHEEKEFVESVGMGYFTETMWAFQESPESEADDDPQLEMERVKERLIGGIGEYSARDWTGTLDGEQISGRFLAVLAMNVGSFGPQLSLVPDADPGDELLRVVTLTEEDRRVVSRLVGDRRFELPASHLRVGRSLRLAPPDLMRVDGKFFDPRDAFGSDGEIEVCLTERFVEVLVGR
jgi:diacylglycerol kinase (ATP)